MACTYGNGSTDSLMTYAYNLGGALVEQQYPSGRKVKNVLDASGDLSLVQSRKNSNSGYWNYASSFSYNAAGAVTSLQLGNGRWESTIFNARLQPTDINLGTILGAHDLLRLQYSYGDWNGTSVDAAKNNGNIVMQIITVPNSSGNTDGFTATQKYYYDSLNRIDDATEEINSSQPWRQDFSYDRYGNRNFVEANTTTIPRDCGTAPNFTICTADQKKYNPSINSSNNNRIDTSQGYSFDSAGNTVGDSSGFTFVFDAENKHVKAKNAGNYTVGEYYYDGDGKRVKKIAYNSTGNEIETTVFVYDAAGKQIAEYSDVVANTNDAKVAYLTNDHLGSPRINTDANGAVTARHDYHAFGEQITTSERIAHPEYGDDTIRKQFTRYERDTESELDFAEARYYNPMHGRFTTVDPLMASGSTIRPQSWNRYSYSYNKPYKFTDPTGMMPGDYYNEDGDYLGWDGVKDDKIYVVTAKKEVDQIRKTEKAGGTTATSAITSEIELPSLLVRQAAGAAADRTKLPTADDKKGNHHEEAFVAGPAVNGGQETVVNAPPGKFADLSNPNVKVAESDPFGGNTSVLANVTVDVHTHPGGTFTSSSPSSIGQTTIGGTSTSRNYAQSPKDSPTDFPRAGRSPFPNAMFIAVGVGNNRVYIYNSTQVRATFPLDKFRTITARTH